MKVTGISEKLYLQFLRSKLNTIGRFSSTTAGKLAFDLFCTPYPKYKKQKTPALFQRAIQHSIHIKNGQKIKGYEWNSNNPNGKSILICHGYASYFYKFEQYIQPLLEKGFRVFGIDAPAHGQSEGKYINIIVYKEAIEATIAQLGPIDHFIGHSLGGITLALIAESMPNPLAHKFVLIAPATKTTTTFENFFKMMHLSGAVQKAFLTELSKRTTLPIQFFEADRAIEQYNGPILWVHDQGDKICPYKDLEKFKQNANNNIKFLITNGLGHNKIYKTPEIIDQIVAFLSN
jgi:hypothetical protein